VTQANGEERRYRFGGIESIELTEYAGKFVWVADVAYDVVAPAGGKAIRRGNLKTMVLMDGKALPLLKR